MIALTAFSDRVPRSVSQPHIRLIGLTLFWQTSWRQVDSHPARLCHPDWLHYHHIAIYFPADVWKFITDRIDIVLSDALTLGWYSPYTLVSTLLIALSPYWYPSIFRPMYGNSLPHCLGRWRIDVSTTFGRFFRVRTSYETTNFLLIDDVTSVDRETSQWYLTDNTLTRI